MALKELDNHDESTIREVRKPNNIKKFIKMYNNLCKDCKAKTQKNPSRPMTEYCESCQEIIENIWSK